jgi:1,3-beta-glucan synthase
MKQSKLRRKRVFRYAILYFIMLVVFVGLIVGPIVGGGSVSNSVKGLLPTSLHLMQPNDLNNDDTRQNTPTGPGSEGYTGHFTPTPTATGAAGPTQSAASNKIRLF